MSAVPQMNFKILLDTAGLRSVQLARTVVAADARPEAESDAGSCGSAGFEVQSDGLAGAVVKRKRAHKRFEVGGWVFGA